MTQEGVPARIAVEARVEGRLRQIDSLRQFFNCLTEEDSSRLVHLLCCAAMLREQPGKIGPLMANLMDTSVDNLRNAPARIEHFCAWLGPLIFNFRIWLTPLVPPDHAMKNALERCQAILPILTEAGEYMRASVDVGRIDIAHWDSGLTETLRALIRFAKDKTDGKPHYAQLATLLAETAATLGLRQTYSAEFIRMRVRKRHGKR